MGSQHIATGAVGEEVTVAYLGSLGWRILDRNWRCSHGELDIVAFDPATESLIFCEVKCRRGVGYGAPLEAITREKLHKLIDLAQLWRSVNPVRCRRLRIDGVGVLLSDSQPPQITHVRGLT